MLARTTALKENAVLVSQVLRPVGALVSYVRFKIDRLRLERLMARGLRVGKNVYIMEDVEFDCGYPFLIEIGDDCRISKGVRILAHDATTFRDLGATRIAPVRLLNGVFLGERTLVLPGVTIGPRALVAAGSVVNRDLGEDVVAAGNPARPYGKFSELLDKYRERIAAGPVFEKASVEQGAVTRADLLAAVAEHGAAFLRGTPRRDPWYVHADFDEMRSNACRAYEHVAAAREACLRE